MAILPTVETMWAQNRICNRYKPLMQNVKMAELAENRRVEVIIMDSGVNKDHPEFADATVEDLYFVPALGSTSDDLGHGTALASLVVGKTLGVNTQAVVKVVKIAGQNFEASHGELAAAFDAVLAHHAGSPEVFKILSLSWDVPVEAETSFIRDYMKKFADAGVLVVASAGNQAVDIDTIYPVSYPDVFAVAGSTKLDGELVALYGTNKKLDMYAPAEDVLVADHWTLGYKTMSGASLSTAMVAGIMSILAGLFDSLPTAQDVKAVTKKYATPVALSLNSKVGMLENRLAYRPDTCQTPLNQDYYAGNMTVGQTGTMEVYLQSIMPLQQHESLFGAMDYSIEWTSAEAEALFTPLLTLEGTTLTLKAPVDFAFEDGEVIKQFSFVVHATNTGITYTSPKIHFFMTSMDTNGHDVAASVDSLSAQSYLVPLTLSQLQSFK